jgi:glyoxylase-like metal-dependent hydrolase (beta-lactamase superfamily II)
MKIFPIVAENFKMDGGACFGVVPKSIWQKQVKADENNMIPLISRCLLVDTGSRIILFDTGMGKKQDEKYFSHFHVFGQDNMADSFKKAGYSFDQVTDVILTHLHFDHAGGALENTEDGSGVQPVFPGATYYCSKAQWEWAMKPNAREKAAYLPENYMPLYEKGQLEFVHEDGEFCPGVFLELKNGHTRGLIIARIDYNGKTAAFLGDFIPTSVNIPIPYIASFDVDPLLAMQEKQEFLQRAVNEDYIMIFQHDYFNECCSLQKTDKGIRTKDFFKIQQI